jgi:hypothetical protein
MKIRDSSDLHFALHLDHERAFVERLDPADVEAGAACQASEEEGVAWRAKLVGGRRRSDG